MPFARGAARRPGAALAAAALAAACAGARAPRDLGAPERRAFEVPGHGALEVGVPRGWVGTAVAGEWPAPVAIRLEPPGGGFVILLTPFWSPGRQEDAGARADIAQRFADMARRRALATSQEDEVPLEDLGGGATGYWFAATDRELVGREPEPDEWRHIVQGAAAVGSLVVSFALLDDEPGPQREAVLDLVRGARHVALARSAEDP